MENGPTLSMIFLADVSSISATEVSILEVKTQCYGYKLEPGNGYLR